MLKQEIFLCSHMNLLPLKVTDYGICCLALTYCFINRNQLNAGLATATVETDFRILKQLCDS